jgi:hypothetical protein
MKFRPGDLPQADPTEEDGPVEWADNSLSNTLAYLSYKLTPSWCQSEEHWTAKVTQYLFTDCPCCMIFRGLVLGGGAGLLAGVALSISIWAVFAALR